MPGGGAVGGVGGGVSVIASGPLCGRAQARSNVTLSIVTSSTGRSRPSVFSPAILSTTARLSASATSPKMVCLPVSHVVAATVMKNCDPLVPGPALAIASRYGFVKPSSGGISSLNRQQRPPVRVPSGSPPWIMNPLITRWKTVPSYRRSLVRLPLRGSVHSRLPSASSTKLATVLGAWLGNSCRRISPWLVDRVAYRSSATALLGGLVGGHAILA